MSDQNISGRAAPISEENLSFEAALTELDEVARTLEAGNISLEASLALLQRGMQLATYCDETLGRAESVLEQLTLSSDGELSLQRLQWVDDDNEDSAEDEDDA